MPQSIPAGLTKEHVLRTLLELDADIDHPFGDATDYELVHDGKHYAPQAVIGLAFRHLTGQALRPESFSGGEAPGQANFVLRKLGFTIVKKVDEDNAPQTGKDWTEREVRLIVADYFDMLEAELREQPYKKSDHRKSLIPQLSGRSKSSVEFKHQNLSGVLVAMGLPYIEGYKPRSNYQSILTEEVESYLEQRPNFLQELAASPVLNPTQPKSIPNPLLTELIEEPPEKNIAPNATDKPWLSRKVRNVDFAAKDAANRQLGNLGEQFVFDLEKYRLNLAGRDDLAKRVIWASRDIGDGLGFDIISFDETDDSERMLEVKATGQGKFSSFYVTSNEVCCSEDIPQQYQLYRLFDFGRSPRLYILQGSLKERCQLQPTLYRAVV